MLFHFFVGKIMHLNDVLGKFRLVLQVPFLLDLYLFPHEYFAITENLVLYFPLVKRNDFVGFHWVCCCKEKQLPPKYHFRE